MKCWIENKICLELNKYRERLIELVTGNLIKDLNDVSDKREYEVAKELLGCTSRNGYNAVITVWQL